MDGRNIIVIESNIYTHEVKYFWKNAAADTMSDLSEKRNSPFSRTKPDYQKFSSGLLTEIAREAVGIIEHAYNGGETGLCIEVMGTEEEYLAVKNAIEVFFADRQIDCIWSGHMQFATEAAPKIREIYRKLKQSLSACDDIIKLSDENDGKGWLRKGFDGAKTDSEKELRDMCAGAGVYLEKVIAEIEEQAAHNGEEISELESRLSQREESPKPGTEINTDKLSKILTRICRTYPRKIGREFEAMLKEKEEKYLDADRIAGNVKNAQDYAAAHQTEWRKSSSRDNPAEKGLDEEKRRACILNRLAGYLNADIRQYVDEVNSAGVLFGNQKAEELKKNFLKEIYYYYSKEFTRRQQITVRQRLGALEVSYHTLRAKEQTGEDVFHWTRKTFEEKEVCKEYERILRKNLNTKRDEALNGNSRVFEEWGKKVFKMWKKQDSDVQHDSLQRVKQMKAELESCREKSGRLGRLQGELQESRKEIERLLSFRKG